MSKPHGGNKVTPGYIGLREVPGAQPLDAVLGVCAREATQRARATACHSARPSKRQLAVCCVTRLLAVTTSALLARSGGVPTRGGWRRDRVCCGAAPQPFAPRLWQL